MTGDTRGWGACRPSADGDVSVAERKSDAGSRTYLTLDEALESATARVSEVSDGGSVPELLFKNLGDKPVLLVEGEELVGAKQNRTLNVSILAPPGRETRIPVTCVEAGRWGYGDGVEFQRSDRAHYARGRRTKREAVNQNMSRDPGSRAVPIREPSGRTSTRRWRRCRPAPTPAR